MSRIATTSALLGLDGFDLRFELGRRAPLVTAASDLLCRQRLSIGPCDLELGADLFDREDRAQTSKRHGARDEWDASKQDRPDDSHPALRVRAAHRGSFHEAVHAGADAKQGDQKQDNRDDDRNEAHPVSLFFLACFLQRNAAGISHVDLARAA